VLEARANQTLHFLAVTLIFSLEQLKGCPKKTSAVSQRGLSSADTLRSRGFFRCGISETKNVGILEIYGMSVRTRCWRVQASADILRTRGGGACGRP